MLDHPNVPVKPPVILLAFLILGGGAYYLWPLGWGVTPAGMITGSLLIGGGAWLMAAAIKEFAAAETNIPTDRPATTIVTTGPYGWSRNPIYIAGCLLFLGIGITFGNGWLLALFMPFFLILNVWVIDREETYLAEKFGEDYIEYQKLVRRWL